MDVKGKSIVTSESERKEVSWEEDVPNELIVEVFQHFTREEAPMMFGISKKWDKVIWETSLSNPCILFISPDSRNDTQHLWLHKVRQNEPTEEWSKTPKVQIPMLPCRLQYISPGSFRGWFCSYNKTGKSAMVNPTRSVYKMLPKVLKLNPAEETHYYLGFDLEKHILKVFCFIKGSWNSRLQTLNLLDGKMSWETVGNTLSPLKRHAICSGGSLYFIYENVLACIDLKTEERKIIQGPPIGAKRFDRLVNVNGSLALLSKSIRTSGARAVWTLDTGSSWSKLPYEIPPFPQATPNRTYECLGTIAGTTRFIFQPSHLLNEEPLHVIHFDPKTSTPPVKVTIGCQTRPPSRFVEGILDFVETPNNFKP